MDGKKIPRAVLVFQCWHTDVLKVDSLWTSSLSHSSMHSLHLLCPQAIEQTETQTAEDLVLLFLNCLSSHLLV